MTTKARKAGAWPRALGVAALVLAVALAGIRAGTSTSVARAAGRPTEKITAKAEAFHDAMRKLWEDHITWTRMFIVSFASGLPDLQPTTDRLLQNQVDIGSAVKPFYGAAAGNQLTDLLKTHILTAADLLAAAKAGDQQAFDQAKKAWYANAREIAGFLHSANPTNWPLPDLRAMMKEHLDLTLAEASDRLGGNYAQDIVDYDAVHTEILQMADMLSSGIIAQFPKKFA